MVRRVWGGLRWVLGFCCDSRSCVGFARYRFLVLGWFGRLEWFDFGICVVLVCVMRWWLVLVFGLGFGLAYGFGFGGGFSGFGSSFGDVVGVFVGLLPSACWGGVCDFGVYVLLAGWFLLVGAVDFDFGR